MRRLALPALLLLALPVLARASSGKSRYLRATPDAETERILAAAVDRAAANVSWVYRGIARPRLAEVATACPAYTFHIEGDAFQVACDGRDPFRWQVGQTGSFTDPKGAEQQVELLRKGSAYHLTIKGDQGGKAWVYAFGDGGALRVEQRVFSPHLGEDMVWTLDYRVAP